MEDIAVLIPCYNEALTISSVIEAFQQTLGCAKIYVYDNGSTDDTIAIAQIYNVTIKEVKIPGKGNVVKQMFADIHADIYILIDGDHTYDVKSAEAAIQLLKKNSLDMVICTRHSTVKNTYPACHLWGNRCFTQMVNLSFSSQLSDVLSGYRVFSKRFVKSFPLFSRHFEIEIEMTIHALQLGLPIAEIKTPYQARPNGSKSKLKTIKDGFKIFHKLMSLIIYVKPFYFFGLFFSTFFILTMVVGIYISFLLGDQVFISIYLKILLLFSILCAFFSILLAIILESINQARFENKKLWYLLHTKNEIFIN